MRAPGRLHLLIVLVLAGCETGSRTAPGGGIARSADDLFTSELIPRFELTLTDEARDQLARSPKKWVRGRFTYAGQVFDDVGVRLKGNRSAAGIDAKPSFKLRFDKFVPGRRFLGQTELVLNNLAEDPTMVREALAYQLHRELGVAAPRTGYVELVVNGAPYGVYLDVEAVDEQLLARAYGDGGGSLYEGEYGCDAYPSDVARLEQDGGEDDDRAGLAALAEVAESAPERLFAADGPLDRERVLAYLAVSAVIGDFDGYRHSHNYRLYRDPASGRWSLLPWGLDRTFKRRLDLTDSGGLLARRCFADAACRLDYLRMVERALDHLEALAASGDADRLMALVDHAARRDRKKPYSAAQTRAARADLRRFLAQRGEELRPLLEQCREGFEEACSGEDAGAEPACAPVVAGGVTFQLCDAPRTWADAQATCGAMGLQLAWLDDRAQSTAIGKALKKRGSKDRWWIGLSDRGAEGAFRWTGGGAPAEDVTRWSKKQPDDGACGEDCVAIKSGGKWSDGHCELRRPFVCR